MKNHMKFGLLKSKIEAKLISSFGKPEFAGNVRRFKKLVLEDKNASKLYHLYNELYSEKGYSCEFAEKYLNECVSQLKSLVIPENTMKSLVSWVGGVECDNQYQELDSILGSGILTIEDVVKNKELLIERLASPSTSEPEVINIPLESMVNVANETIVKYLSDINESEIVEIAKYVSLSQEDIMKRYQIISEMVIEKLDRAYDVSDGETKTRIDETKTRIVSDKIDFLALYKLKALNDSL